MAFLTGPRQVGKTTLADLLARNFDDHKYYNWDSGLFKKTWVKDPQALIPKEVGKHPLIIFDELHKAPRWKNTLKGIYDLNKDDVSIIVTGSARLDVFRKGGDSLLGRYFLFRLHPFSVGELSSEEGVHPDKISSCLSKKIKNQTKIFTKLIKYGGFPDPYLRGDDEYYNIWQTNKNERFVREDIVDFTKTREIGLIEVLMSLIPERVGSPLSIQSLAEDLDINHPTTKRWIEWLSQLFYLYTVTPYSKNVARAIKKQPKVYLWDWSIVDDKGARFENLVASHLLKACHFWVDTGKGAYQLNYVRDKEKREVDFIITKKKKCWMLVECKHGVSGPSDHLLHYANKFTPEMTIQIVAEPGVHERFKIHNNNYGDLISADKFLSLLP